MDRLVNVENGVKQLTAEELRGFREWFLEFDANTWDRQFESDVRAGKLDALADQALHDHRAGKSTDL